MGVVLHRAPPYGAIIFTFLSVAFGLIAQLVLSSNEDSFTTVRWSTSFFMAGVIFFLAMHVGIFACSNLGFLALSILSIGFVFEGCAYKAFDNTGGLSDGLQSNTFLFYLFTIVQYSFWTLSTVVWGWIFGVTWSELQYESIGTKLSRVFSFVLTVSLISVLIAAIWAAFFASSDIGDNLLDKASSKSEHRDQVAFRYFRISQWVWYGLFFLFYVVAAAVLRPVLHAIRYEADIVVWGLSSVWAVDGVIFFQLASLGLLVFFVVESYVETPASSSAMSCILLTFHYCMLMSFYFLYNLVFSLSHIVFEHDYFEVDEMELGVKDDIADDTDDTSECSSIEDGGKRSIHGPGGAEIVLIDMQSLEPMASNY